MIPKVIHYCWLSGDAYPPKIVFCINSWKKYLPDYDIVLWDRSRFDIESCLWVKQAYDCKKYAFAADYIRLWVLYHYGGIYLDSDVEVLKPFDRLLNQPYFFGVESNEDKFLEAAVMGVEPRNEFIHQCLMYYEGRSFLSGSGMDLTPLPRIMFKFLNDPIIISNENEFALGINQLQLYTKEFFSPKNGVNGELSSLTKNTYTIHHYNASWYPAKKKIYIYISKCLGGNVAKKLSKLYHQIIGR